MPSGINLAMTMVLVVVCCLSSPSVLFFPFDSQADVDSPVQVMMWKRSEGALKGRSRREVRDCFPGSLGNRHGLGYEGDFSLPCDDFGSLTRCTPTECLPNVREVEQIVVERFRGMMLNIKKSLKFGVLWYFGSTKGWASFTSFY